MIIPIIHHCDVLNVYYLQVFNQLQINSTIEIINSVNMSLSHDSQLRLISFVISFNLQTTSVFPRNVEDIKSRLDGNKASIVPVGYNLNDGEFNVIAFQPNCKKF